MLLFLILFILHHTHTPSFAFLFNFFQNGNNNCCCQTPHSTTFFQFSNIFCNSQLERNCPSTCNQGHYLPQTYSNPITYQNGYQNGYQENYSTLNNKVVSNQPTQLSYISGTGTSNQHVVAYQTTRTPLPTYQTDFNFEVYRTQSPQYNLGSKHISGDLPSSQSVNHQSTSIISELNNTSKQIFPQTIDDYTSKNENIPLSFNQQTSTTPKYIRPSEPVYSPNFNFPLSFATTTTTSSPDYIKINLKKTSSKDTKDIDNLFVKKSENSYKSDYEDNSSFNLYPKESQVYKPKGQSKEPLYKSLKKEETNNIEESTEDGNIKIAGLNYFNDPINTSSSSNSIYDEVVPFDEDIDQVEVVPSPIPTSDINTNLPGIQKTLEYDEDDNHLNDNRVKAKASKQYKKENPIITNIINDDLVKIPLESTYERCNDINLLTVMKKSMLSSPVISKQIIFSSWKKEYNQNLDVICSKIPFSYTVVSSSVFCEIQTASISCFAYIQPNNKN